MAAIFSHTTPSDSSITRLRDEDLGPYLFDKVAQFLDHLGVPRGLKAIGYKEQDVERLVNGALPQRRVLDLAPGIGNIAGEDGQEHLTEIVQASMSY
jgi:hydroxyacid-oxoacid transhydrogenase